MNEQMANAPVYYALAQAQFNPIAAMSKYVDEVQDLLRREGYTLFETQEIPQLQLVVATEGGVPVVPNVSSLTTWRMTRPDRSAGFILNQTSVTYHTTHYQTRREFLPAVLQGVKAVHKVVSLDHVSRLGLRYLDAVLPADGETVDQYLADGLRGVQIGAAQRYASSEFICDTQTGPLLPQGTLVARVHRLTASLGFPPDIMPSGLTLMERFTVREASSHAVIDTDHFVEGAMPLDLEKMGEQLLSLHAGIRQAFDAIVSAHAKAVWA